MQYMNYYSTAYSQLIASLRQNIKAVDAKKSETKETKQELDKIASKTSEQKQVLEKEKARHAALGRPALRQVKQPEKRSRTSRTG